MSDPNIPPLPERKCEHGVPFRSMPNWQGGWSGGVSECKCCYSVFGYIDHGAYGTEGWRSTSWQPKNLCGVCGGKYETIGSTHVAA